MVKIELLRPCYSPDLAPFDFDHCQILKNFFCTHGLGSDASNIQRSIRNELFPIDSNVKIAKDRHSKKIGLDNNKF
jgi:hypothetical protein